MCPAKSFILILFSQICTNFVVLCNDRLYDDSEFNTASGVKNGKELIKVYFNITGGHYLKLGLS